jgi:ABC-2 type transport system ATP-binding protein
LIAEDSPSQLRARLGGRVLELRGRPLNLLRRLAAQDQAVEAVRALGDRLHLRVRASEVGALSERLPASILDAGGTLEYLRPAPAALEDVFIYLSEQTDE